MVMIKSYVPITLSQVSFSLDLNPTSLDSPCPLGHENTMGAAS